MNQQGAPERQPKVLCAPLVVTVGTPEPLPDQEPEDVRPLAQVITTYPDTFQVERLDLGIGALGPQCAEVTRYIDSQLQLRRITALRLSGRTA